MCYDRITSINNSGIITSFVEHTHINTEYVGEINSTSGTTGIRADYHQFVIADFNVRFCTEQTFYKLISWLNRFKPMKRNRILNTRVMSVKSNDVVNSHVY